MRPHILLPLALLAASPAGATPLKILADTPVTASLVQQVTGDLAEVEVLLDKGADPHSFQLRPSQARALQGTDMLVWIGPEMTPWLDRAAAQMDPQHQLPLLHDSVTQTRDYAGDEDHAHDHGHATPDGAHAFDPHLDPHAWLDPDNGAAWLGVIASRLGASDPENAQTYAANANAAQAQLAKVDAALAGTLAPVTEKAFVTFHDAYGYFTHHYGLPDAIAVSLGDASAPSAARLSEVRAKIAESGAVCAFPEANQSPDAIETVIDGTALRMGEALSPEGVDIPSGPDLYNRLLESLGQRVAACLGS